LKDKRPAFQWYPMDYLSDINTISMTPEQEGHYLRLINICWLENGIPCEWVSIQALLKGTTNLLESELQLVLKCFYKKGSKLQHKRLDYERAKQDKYRERSASGGRETQRRRAELKGTKIKRQVKSNTSSSSSSSTSLKDIKTCPKFYEFPIAWKAYPAQIGRKDAERHYRATVKKQPDHARLMEGMRRYKEFVLEDGRPWLNGSTFFNQWQEWVEFEPAKQVQKKNNSGPRRFSDEHEARMEQISKDAEAEEKAND